VSQSLQVDSALAQLFRVIGSDKPSESDAKKMSESLDIKKTVGIKVVLKIKL